MSDPGTARTGSSRSGPEPHRWERRLTPRRRAAVTSLARALFIAVGLVTAYYLLPLDNHDTIGASTLLACGLLAVVVVFLWELRLITRSPYPRLKAVEALAATLALFLVTFAGVYFLLDSVTPGSFSEPLNKTDALYFTLTVFSTVGFGDITARSQTGRVVVMLQMAGGLLLVGVAARLLASAIQAGLRRQAREPPAGPDAGTDRTPPNQEAGS